MLVTGGAGFIGSHLVDALLARGDDVRILDDLSSGRLDSLAGALDRVEFVEGSILDGALVEELAERCSAVVHLAAIASVPRSIAEPELVRRVNVEGSKVVAEATRRAGACLVFASSSAVYGEAGEEPLGEERDPNPMSPYAEQKLEGEALAHDGASLRFFNVYGPRQDPRSDYAAVIPAFLHGTFRGEPLTIYGSGDQTRDFVFVEDVVRAVLLALDSRRVGLVANVASGVRTSVNHLADLVEHVTGSKPLRTYLPARKGDVQHSVGDPSLAARVLGFRAESGLEAGLRRCLAALA